MPWSIKPKLLVVHVDILTCKWDQREVRFSSKLIVNGFHIMNFKKEWHACQIGSLENQRT